MSDNSYICGIFNSINTNCLIENVVKKTEEIFSATVHLKSEELEGKNYSERCDTWVRKFETLTNCGYISKKTKPKLKRFAYKKIFVCQHSSLWKSKDSKKLRNRDKKCDASTIHFTFKKHHDVDGTTRDKYLQQGFDVEINVKFNHTHRTKVAESMSFLRVSPATINQYEQYFNEEMGASAAKTYHELRIITDHEEKGSDYSKALANTRLNPTARTVKHLYTKWRSNKHGERTERSVVEVLKEKAPIFEEKGVKISIQEVPLIVVVITPLMQRAHKRVFARETCFIDSSGSCDQMGSTTTFFFAASKLGAVPLACVFHTEQSEENYYKAFNAVKECIGPEGFGGQGYPSICMTDDSLAERNALRRVFPQSVLLLCHFHVCQAIWRWLWDPKNKIHKEDRKYLMNIFRELLYCKEEIIFNELLSIMKKDKVFKKYSNFETYVNNLLVREEEWALHHRLKLLTRGNNTNNYVEASIRIFKDVILQRCKAFNICSLVDFVVNVMEKYHIARLNNFACKKDTSFEMHYKNLLIKSRDVNVERLDETTFYVSSSEDPLFKYTIDTNLEVCDCLRGQDGRFCKHLQAVCSKFKIAMFNSPKLSYSKRVDFAKIALGEQIDPMFYKSMEYNASSDERDDSGEEVCSNNVNSMEVSDTIHTQIDVDNDFPEGENENNLSAKTEIENLQNNFINITTILTKSNQSTFVAKKLRLLNIKLSKVENTDSFISMIVNGNFNVGKQCNKRLIAVQPSSVCRRMNRPGFKTGKRRIQSGALTKAEKFKYKRTASVKRKRNLAANIAKNVPNAKPH